MKSFLLIVFTLYVLFDLIIFTAKCTVVYIIVKHNEEISDELAKNICEDFTHIYRKLFVKIKNKFVKFIKPPGQVAS